MVVDDVHLMNILKGKRIKLTLRTSSFFGDVQRINPNRSLVLNDVVDASNGCKIPGSKLFFGNEIINVEFTSESNNDIRTVPDSCPEVERFKPYMKMITIDDDDEGERVNIVVIDEFHEKFAPAVMHIKKQHVIGVGASGVELFRHGRLCWLQIATKNKVYLFDILLLGAQAFKNGLSAILECKDILKVIHDCRAIAGCLSVQFGLKMNNVFDTQVADVMCFHSETGGFLPDRVSTLQEVISLHLKVPSSKLRSLERQSQSTEEEKEMWFIRPCPVTLMKAMALAVVHLQPLRLVLMDTLMVDYMTLVDSYINSSQYEPDELQHVGKDVLAMPRELMKLQQMYQERNQWATKHYPVTEPGLLARFEPRTTPPSKPSPELQAEGSTQSESFKPPSVPQEVTPPRITSHCMPQTRKATTVSAKENRSVPFPEGVGSTEALMNTIGRGKPVGKEQSSTYNLTPKGRGFFFQEPPVQIPEENTGTINRPGRMEMTSLCPGLTPTQKVMPQPDLPPASPESLLCSLTQSFRSFRH